jgi:hypothetical protein
MRRPFGCASGSTIPSSSIRPGLSVVPVAFEAEAFQEAAFQVTGAVVARAADQRWDAETVAGHCVADWQRVLRDVRLLDELSRPAP